MANLYESLSNEPLYQHMFKHKDEHTAIIEVQLPTLHCSSCVKAVETLPNIAPGIISVRVNFSQKLAQIKYQRNKWSLQQVIEKVDDMGYPPDISLASANHITQSPVNHRRRASIDLGVAGFASHWLFSPVGGPERPFWGRFYLGPLMLCRYAFKPRWARLCPAKFF